MANPPPVPVCHKIITPAIMTSLGMRLTKSGRVRHEESVKKGGLGTSVESKEEGGWVVGHGSMTIGRGCKGHGRSNREITWQA